MSNSRSRIIAILVALFLAACASRPSAVTREQQRALDDAGQRLGVPVRTATAVYAERNGVSVLTASALNLEQIPATELRSGIDLGVTAIGAPGARDFYRVRATADVTDVGQTNGLVTFLDANGRTVAESPASVDVWSMRVPPEAANNPTQITAGGRDRCDGVWTCYQCTNGQTVCYCAMPFDRGTTD